MNELNNPNKVNKVNKKLLLLVEDNEKLQNYNRRMLIDEGFDVETVATLTDAREFLERGRRPDAMILDIGMPDGNGLDFLSELRRAPKASKVPVLLLTGYSKPESIVSGFERGCDDYIIKPCRFDVLLVRLQHLLKSAAQVPETIEKGPLKFDVMAGLAFLNGKDMLLTQKEFALLLNFVQQEGQSMSAEYLYEKAWGRSMGNDANAVRMVVSRLRLKLTGSGYTITAIRGEGYCFELYRQAVP